MKTSITAKQAVKTFVKNQATLNEKVSLPPTQAIQAVCFLSSYKTQTIDRSLRQTKATLNAIS